MKRSKGFTLIELIVVIVIFAVIGSVLFGDSDAEKIEACVEESTFIDREDRQAYCVDELREAKRNQAIILSGN